MNVKIHIISFLLLLGLVNSLTAQLVNKTLFHDGETRAYTVYIPSSYDGTTEVPLLFNFHGGGGDIASQIAISDMRPLADNDGFIVVYPQALPDPNAGGSAIWTHKEPTTVDDVFFVDAMIDAMVADYSIDQNRVYACGYSNGGEFTFELACRLSNRIAAIGVVARSMFIDTYDSCAPTHPMAVVTIHGTNDDYNGIIFQGTTYYVSLDDVNSYWSNYNNTDPNPVIVQLPNTNTSDGSTVEHYSWNNGDGCVSVEHFKVINGGHDWPGSFGNMDINSNTEIWSFVSKYDLNGLIDCSTTSNTNLEVSSDCIRVFPNPVNNQFTISGDLSLYQIEILDASGQVFQVVNSMGNTQSIDISTLPNGLYFIRATHVSNSQLMIQKIIKY